MSQVISIKAVLAAGALSTILVSAAMATHNSPASLTERVEAVGNINIESGASAAAAAAPAQDGPTVYNTACAACHASGVGGAPLFGDASQWTDRIAQGEEVMINNAINGFQGNVGYMPAKGGSVNLSDEEVANAVRHMIQGVQ